METFQLPLLPFPFNASLKHTRRLRASRCSPPALGPTFNSPVGHLKKNIEPPSMATAPSTPHTLAVPTTLTGLTPTQFENLVFDLMTAMGLKNVTWRTPGPDGGRDIEAEQIEPDFAGVHTKSKWFIECKRYQGSVDWPTIYDKLAYADSEHADYLLMCTPSKYTPAAITQATKWNSDRRALKIRLWPGHELEQQLRKYPDIESKYGLSTAQNTPGHSVVTLALALSKTIASHHSQIVFSGEEPDRMLRASQSLADLLLQRMEDIKRRGRLEPVFKPLPSDSRWILSGNPFKVDYFALQAFLSYLYALTNTQLSVIGENDFSCIVAIDKEMSSALERYQDVFKSIALWGDFEYVPSSVNLKISQRSALR